MYRFGFVLLCLWGQFAKYKPPGEGFLRYRSEGLIHGGSYFRNFTVVHLYLLYDDIYSVRIWITSFRRFWYKYQIHEHRVQVRIGSSTPPAGKVRFKSYFKLSTNFTFVAIRQLKIMIKNTYYLQRWFIFNEWGSKAWDGCLQAKAINVLHSIMRFWLLDR